MTINKDVAVGDDGLKDKNLDDAGADVVVEDKDDEEDKKLSDVINPLLEGDDEEEVTIKRGVLKKHNAVKENYKVVAIAAKKKKEPIAPKPEEKKEEKSEFVKVADVQKKNERDAISRATTVADSDDESTQALKKEIDENWDAIKGFYTGKSGKDDSTLIYEDILDAHAAWKRRFGSSKENKGGKAAADLAAQRGGGGTSGKKAADGQRKRILPRAGSPKETWYPEVEK